MASPLFAIAGRGEQAIDQLLPGVRGFVVQEALDLFRGGRQAEQIVAGAAQQRQAVGFDRGLHFRGLQFLGQERVDGTARTRNVRNCGPRRRLKGPPLRAGGFDGSCIRPFGALLDPCAKNLDLGFGQLRPGRHGQLARVRDGLEQQALCRLRRA